MATKDPEDVFDEGRIHAREIEKEEAKSRQDYEQLLKDLCELMDLPAGQRVLWYMLEIGGPFRSPYATNSTVYFLCGKQASSMKLLEDLKRADIRRYHRLEELQLEQEKKEESDHE